MFLETPCTFLFWGYVTFTTVDTSWKSGITLVFALLERKLSEIRLQSHKNNQKRSHIPPTKNSCFMPGFIPSMKNYCKKHKAEILHSLNVTEPSHVCLLPFFSNQKQTLKTVSLRRKTRRRKDEGLLNSFPWWVYFSNENHIRNSILSLLHG